MPWQTMTPCFDIRLKFFRHVRGPGKGEFSSVEEGTLRLSSNGLGEKIPTQKTDDSVVVWPFWRDFFVTLGGPGAFA